MKTLNQILALAGVAAALCLSTGDLAAQGRQRGGGNQGQGGGRGGNMDPAQFRQRMIDGYRDRLEVTNDDEWKVISERIDKVLTAQRDARGGGGRNMGGGRRGSGGTTDTTGGGRGNQPGPFSTEPNTDMEALQKALDTKAPPEEVKAKIAKARESLKVREAKLTAAQDDLRKVLTMRQEGLAIVVGLLK